MIRICPPLLNFLNKLSSKGIEIQGYAYDIVIITNDKFNETLWCDIIQEKNT